MIPLIKHESIYVSVKKNLSFCWDQVHSRCVDSPCVKKTIPTTIFDHDNTENILVKFPCLLVKIQSKSPIFPASTPPKSVKSVKSTTFTSEKPSIFTASPVFFAKKSDLVGDAGQGLFEVRETRDLLLRHRGDNRRDGDLETKTKAGLGHVDATSRADGWWMAWWLLMVMMANHIIMRNAGWSINRNDAWSISNNGDVA